MATTTLPLSSELAQQLARATARYHESATQAELTARMHNAAQTEFQAAERELRELGRAIAIVRAQTQQPPAADAMEARIAAAVRSALGVTAPATTPPAPATPPAPVKLDQAAIDAAGGDPEALAVLRAMADNPGKPLPTPGQR